MKCLFCHADNPEDTMWCKNCGKQMIQNIARLKHKLELESEYDEETIDALRELHSTLKPEIGGILLIISGTISLISAGLVMWAVSILGSAYNDPLYHTVEGIVFLFIIADFIGIIGGVFAIIRKNFVGVILGAVLAVIGGFLSFFMIGFILAFIAILIIAASHSEFQ